MEGSRTQAFWKMHTCRLFLEFARKCGILDCCPASIKRWQTHTCGHQANSCNTLSSSSLSCSLLHHSLECSWEFLLSAHLSYSKWSLSCGSVGRLASKGFCLCRTGVERGQEQPRDTWLYIYYYWVWYSRNRQTIVDYRSDYNQNVSFLYDSIFI